VKTGSIVVDGGVAGGAAGRGAPAHEDAEAGERGRAASCVVEMWSVAPLGAPSPCDFPSPIPFSRLSSKQIMPTLGRYRVPARGGAGPAGPPRGPVTPPRCREGGRQGGTAGSLGLRNPRRLAEAVTSLTPQPEEDKITAQDNRCATDGPARAIESSTRVLSIAVGGAAAEDERRDRCG